jgi:hypothetical protein
VTEEEDREDENMEEEEGKRREDEKPFDEGNDDDDAKEEDADEDDAHVKVVTGDKVKAMGEERADDDGAICPSEQRGRCCVGSTHRGEGSSGGYRRRGITSSSIVRAYWPEGRVKTNTEHALSVTPDRRRANTYKSFAHTHAHRTSGIRLLSDTTHASVHELRCRTSTLVLVLMTR